MATALPVKNALYREERSEEVTILCGTLPPAFDGAKGYIALGAPSYRVRVLRITRDYYADKAPVIVAQRYVERDMAQLMADMQAPGMLATLPHVFDRWTAEDDTPPLPEEVPPEEAPPV